MTLALLTTSGLLTHLDVASLEDYTDVEGKEIFHIEFFNPKLDALLIDKKSVLMIQVGK